ncbi:MAG TPA: hypothetical protein VJ624_00930 [Thermodesulfobacteriota bacterium]|nr:hypothetical protein [Thermodesulfobacteriota bacterium]
MTRKMTFGLYPHKGGLQPGVDAALSPSSCDYTPYEGWKLKGWPVLTMVRGKVVMEDGKVKDASGWGRAVGVS